MSDSGDGDRFQDLFSQPPSDDRGGGFGGSSDLDRDPFRDRGESWAATFAIKGTYKKSLILTTKICSYNTLHLVNKGQSIRDSSQNHKNPKGQRLVQVRS